MEALRALLHRYASVVWAACALACPDAPSAAAVFADTWHRVFSGLESARLSPDLAGLVLGICRARLLEGAGPEQVAKALASAGQLSSEGDVAVEVPPGALVPVAESVAQHGARLVRETEARRERRRRSLMLPVGLLLAVVVGLGVAALSAGRRSVGDVVAKGVRLRVIEGDLVPLFRDCVSSPFSVTERSPAETERFEQVGLILEELLNAPPDISRARLLRVRDRVVANELADFVCEKAEEATGDDRDVLCRVTLVLEEIGNL